MQKYRDIVIDNKGNAILSSQVTVTENVGGGLATIYADDGVTGLANPLTASGVDGAYEFYAANGRYDLSFNATGYVIEQITDITLLDDTGLVKPYANIAALRAITSAPQATHASIKGYTTDGDGGGGDFYWDATSTETDNGGTIIKATAITTGRWKRLYSGAVNVKWFGAIGDDTGDNFSLLTAALAAGEDLYVPSGIFKILISASGTQFTPAANQRIYGNGMNKSILHFVSSTTAQKDIFKLTNSGVTFDSIGIDYDAPVGDGTHLFGMDSDDITIKNCDLDGNNTAIKANVVQCFAWGNDNTVRTRVLNNNIHNFQRCNLRGNTNTGVASDIIYSNNTVYDLGEGGAQFNFPLGAASNVEISHNTFSNFTGGTEQIFCGGGGVEGFRIHSNHFYGAGNECVHLEENVIDAKIWGNNFAISGDGIASSDNNISGTYFGPNRIKIWGNSFRDAAGSPANTGILIPNTGVGLNSAEGVIITGNTFENYLQGIKDDYGTVKITDNIFTNCTTGIIQYQPRPDTEGNMFEDCTTALHSILGAGMFGKNSFRGVTSLLTATGNEKASMLGFRIYIEVDTNLPATTTTNVDIGVDIGAEFYGKMKCEMYIDDTKWRHRISDCDYNGTTFTDTELMMNGSGDVAITNFVNNAGEISLALNNTAGLARTLLHATFDFDGMWVSST